MRGLVCGWTSRRTLRGSRMAMGHANLDRYATPARTLLFTGTRLSPGGEHGSSGARYFSNESIITSQQHNSCLVWLMFGEMCLNES
jgi:hypothetical protein